MVPTRTAPACPVIQRAGTRMTVVHVVVPALQRLLLPPPRVDTYGLVVATCHWPSSSRQPCPGSVSPDDDRSPTLFGRASHSICQFSFCSDQPVVPAASAQTTAGGWEEQTELGHRGQGGLDPVHRLGKSACRAPSDRRVSQRPQFWEHP